jgi:hypothetical protein
VPANDARELVVRLSKALQRAVIYPPGHPAVRHAAGPFLESLHVLLRSWPAATVGVTRDALFVGHDPRHARPIASPWLSARLSGQNIASLRFDGSLSEEEAQRVLDWLVTGQVLSPGTDAPAFAGCDVTRVDFTAARFREERLAAGALPPEELAWQTIARGLIGHTHNATDAPSSPIELAGWVRAGIEHLEGTGIREVGHRIVAAGAHMANLPEPVRASVKARLSQFVSALSPELRGQVLTAAPTDDPAKLDLLAQVVDHLPSHQIVDVVRNLEFKRGGSTHQFMSLMLKLTHLSASDDDVAEALETRYSQEGGQGRLLAIDEAQTRSVLEQLLQPRTDDVVGVNPEEYQRRLEVLSASPTESRPPLFDASRHIDPREPDDVAAQTGRIALHLLRTDHELHEPGETAGPCEFLRDQLPSYLANRDFEMLGDSVVEFTVLSTGGHGRGNSEATEALGFFTEPATVNAVLEAVLTEGPDISPPLLVLARAGGIEFVNALIARLEADEDRQAWSRASELMLSLDVDAIRTTFGRAYKASPRRARGLISLLQAARGLPHVLEVALLFLGDADPAARFDAYHLLFASKLSGARFDTLLRRALEDSEPRIVRLALDEAERRDPPPKPEALARFLDVTSPDRVESQRRAVGILAAQRTADAREVMIDALARRAKALDSPARQVSRSLALAIEAIGGAEALRAVRAWRWSPAGMLTRVIGDGGPA